MKLKKSFRQFLLFSISIVLIFQINSKAQEDIDTQPEENWLRQYNIYQDQYLFHRYDLYSKEDIIKFREKLESINNTKATNEWEGTYSVGYEETVGFSQLRWNTNAGFVDFHIYTCLPELRYVNYGTILDTPEFIQLISDKSYSLSKSRNSTKYVKVRWDERHYLVEESSLLAFAEKAVGIYVESDEDTQKWRNSLVKGDLEKLIKGLPQFPPSYKKFQRSPIETKILEVEKRTIEVEKELGNAFYSEAVWYYVKIDAGKNRNIKVGMTFDIPETREELFITKVDQNTSVGLIRRDFDDNKNDLCHDDEYNPTACPQIKSSLKVKTQIGRFWF